MRKTILTSKNGPRLSCNLHKKGANIYSTFAVAPLCAKKYGPGLMDGWIDGWIDGSMDRWVGGW